MHKFGAHLSINGGYATSLEKIKNIGGNCLQIFSTSPRSWNKAVLNNKTIQKFKELKKQLSIDPIFFHSSYLINLADNEKIGNLSKELLIAELNHASQLNIQGSIIHLGSYKEKIPPLFDISQNPKYDILISNILEIINKTPQNVLFIIENSGNKKIGQSLDEIAQIIKDINNNRVRVCLDSCHLFSAGYDLRTPDKIEKFIKDFDHKIGLNKLAVWHLNDSRDDFDSGHDRHENIGEGAIGKEEFQLILNHPKLKNLPFIIETPGFDNKGPDKKNLDILKKLVIDD